MATRAVAAAAVEGKWNRPFNGLWLSLGPVFGVDGTVLSKASGALRSSGAIPATFS